MATPLDTTREFVPLNPAQIPAAHPSSGVTHSSNGVTHPSNWVVLFRTRQHTVVNFGLLSALGGALGSWMIVTRMIQAGMAPGRFAAALFLLVPALVVIGSRLLVLAQEWRDFVKAPLRTLFKPGFAFQGGFIGGAAGLLGIALTYRLDLLLLADCFALGIPLGHAVGRLGCWSYGCCHGRPAGAHAPGITYTCAESKVVWGSKLGGVRLHPTQLYSVAGNLALFGLLCWMAATERRPGELAAAYLMLGATGRLLVEFLRGIPVRRVLGLSIYQLVTLPLIAAGALLLWLMPGTPHALFSASGSLSAAATAAAAHPWWYLAVFAILFCCFGIHGRKVGKFSD